MELITVQIGSFANFVGAHYWNLQDESIGCSQLDEWGSLASTLNSEVVCMWSEDRHGATSYCPRAVVLDLSGSLGGVSFSQDVSHAASSAAASAAQAGVWAGGVEVHQLGRAAKSRFRRELEAAGQADSGADDADAQEAQKQALEAAAQELYTAQHTPKFWTDYLQVDLQHESVLMLSGAWAGQAGWQGWGPSGSSSSAARDVVEAAVDRVRWWAEQCDHIQGLQLLADDLGGWGGISQAVLTELRDQYPSQPLLYFSLQQQQQAQQQAAAGMSARESAQAARRLLSSALSLCEVPQLASLYVPMAAGAGRLAAHTAAGMGQSAALLAAAVDTATLPLRCTGARSAAGEVLGATDLHSLVHLLTGPAANLAAAALQLPAGCLPPAGGAANGMQQPGSSSSSNTLSLQGSSSSSLAPGVSLAPEHCLAESLTLRGAWGPSEGALLSTSAAKLALDGLLLQRQQQVEAARCVVHSCISPMPVVVPLSFPGSMVLLPPLLPAAVGAAASPPPATAAAGGAGGGSSSSSTARQTSAAAAAAAAGGGAVARPYLPRSAKAAAVRAPAALSRLTASSGFEAVLQGAARDLGRLGPSAAGRACLEEWGYADSDVEELREGLLEAAGRYSRHLEL